jgi:molybdopterin synthase catalytic subunit
MIHLTHEPIDLHAAEAYLHQEEVGGIVTFAGTVRNHSHGRQVLWLEYEAYEEMAKVQLEAIGAAMRERWPIHRLVLIHRIGRLEIGDAAVIVGVATSHRHDAFEACRYGIDTIKDNVPIWKREVFVGGEVWIDDCCSRGKGLPETN